MTDTTEQVVDTTVPDANTTQVVQPDPSTGAVDTSDKSEPRKSGEQKRIDELTWHRRQAERRSKALESENSELRAQLTTRQTAQPEQTKSSNRPDKRLADFNFDEDAHQAYLDDFYGKAAAETVKQREAKEKAETSRKERMTKFREREELVRNEVEDYEDVAYSAPINETVADLITDMEDGPQLLVHLGKNPGIAKRISSMSRELAAAQLVLLSDRLATEREQVKAKPVSKAPPPPPKIDATEPAIEKSPSEMSDAEFAKWRKRQIAQRR